MTSTVDTNVLLYASDTSSVRYTRARELLDELARGSSLTTLFWPVLMGYLQIVTNPRVLRQPLSTQAAMANVEALTGRSNVRTVGEREGFWTAFRETAEPVQPAGNLIPDAHIVTLMRLHGVRDIWTHDRDFRKFDGIVTHDPFS